MNLKRPFSFSPFHPLTFSLLLSLILSLFLLTTCAAPEAIPTPSPAIPTPPPAVLTGQVTIGPLTPGPVLKDAPTPAIPPEMFTARGLQIFAEDGETLIAEVHFKEDGTYRIEIPPGAYVVAFTPLGIETAEGLPQTITLNSGEVYTLDVNIDTGIR